MRTRGRQEKIITVNKKPGYPIGRSACPRSAEEETMKQLLIRFLYWLLDVLEKDTWTNGVGTVLELHNGTQEGWIETRQDDDPFPASVNYGQVRR